MTIENQEKNLNLLFLPKPINQNIELMISLIQQSTNYHMKYRYKIELNVLTNLRILMLK